MNGATRTAAASSETKSDNSLKTIQWMLLGLFIVAIGISIAQQFVSIPLRPGTLDAIVLCLTLVATLAVMCGQLPLQNVLLAAVIIAAIGGGIHALGASTGIPFGPVTYLPSAQPRLFNALPWFSPVLWVVAILSSRGVARLILRPWRKLRVYGFWLIGITAVLAVVFDLGLEVFATRVRHYWLWSPTKLPVAWYGAPLSNFLGWCVTALLILAFATPSMMKRKPGKSVPEFQSLIVWVLLNLLFVAGALAEHLVPAAVVSGAACAVVVAFSVRGARW